MDEEGRKHGGNRSGDQAALLRPLPGIITVKGSNEGVGW